MTKHDGGKGDAPRPLGVSMEEFDANFDRIFGQKKKPKDKSIEVQIDADTGEQQVTVTKTWEF